MNPLRAPEIEWEAAYERFETAPQEIDKFKSRLEHLNIAPRDATSRVLELFAGRANGLHALEHLGFSRIFAMDLSARLLSASRFRNRSSVADARVLPVRDGSIDIVVVQGGLHHLQVLPDDLTSTLSEIHRVLRPGGRLYVVEPALTPFLRIVHAVCAVPLARRLSGKIDALARMIELETPQYQRWLEAEKTTLALLSGRFTTLSLELRWGKLLFAGQKDE